MNYNTTAKKEEEKLNFLPSVNVISYNQNNQLVSNFKLHYM